MATQTSDRYRDAHCCAFPSRSHVRALLASSRAPDGSPLTRTRDPSRTRLRLTPARVASQAPPFAIDGSRGAPVWPDIRAVRKYAPAVLHPLTTGVFAALARSRVAPPAPRNCGPRRPHRARRAVCFSALEGWTELPSVYSLARVGFFGRPSRLPLLLKRSRVAPWAPRARPARPLAGAWGPNSAPQQVRRGSPRNIQTFRSVDRAKL